MTNTTLIRTRQREFKEAAIGLTIPFEVTAVAENRRRAIINYAAALVALGKTMGMDPVTLAGWLHEQYAKAGWYEQFLARHGPANLTAFAEEFANGRHLLHHRSSARIQGDQLMVETEQSGYQADLSACFFLGIGPDEVEQFFDATVALHARHIGFDASLSRDARSETMVARPLPEQL